ncbi:MAG: YceI family protein [Bacteroidota bacterium]
MMRTIVTSVLLFTSLSLGYAQTIDASNSKVAFEVSNMYVNYVDGTFTGMSGTINFNPQNLSAAKFDVCVQANTVFTDNEERDEHLKNEDFFHVDRYPTICIRSSQISKTSSGYMLKGTLNLHGVTKDIEVPFTYANKTFEGSFEIDRDDYKVGEDYNSFMVGSDIEIDIICKVR